MTDLTEKLKKGELPYAEYYIKLGGGEYTNDVWDVDGWQSFNKEGDVVVEVLAPVPSYEEWIEKTKSLKVLAEAYCKEKQQNAQLKELLKELIEKDIGTICDLKSILERMNYGGAEYDTLKNIIHDFETDINRYEDKINEI